MISVSIWRKTLVANHACFAGLALFDAIAAQQPKSDPRRLRRIRIPRWTALHWIMLVQAGFGEWCAIRGIVPRADLYGANLYGANLYGVDLSGVALHNAWPEVSARLRAADAEVERLRGALRNVRDDYDCDGVGTGGLECRHCIARAALGEP